MRFKTFTQAYFLIRCNDSYSHSLIKRAQAITNSLIVVAIGAYAWWPTRFPASDNIQ